LADAPDPLAGPAHRLLRGKNHTVDTIEALRARRSIGKLDGDVPDAELRELIELATWAPNHKLTEPWRFTVLRGAARERLGALWAQIAGRETELSGEMRDELMRRTAFKPLRAPVIVAVSVRTDEKPVTAIEDFAAASAAVQNMLLAAHARGFGAIWRTGELAYRDEIKTFLGLDPTDRIVAFVYLGRPAMTAPPPRPRALEGAITVLDA
jgi:nitroreductase